MRSFVLVDTDIDALASLVKAKFHTFDPLFVNTEFSIPTPFRSVIEAIYDEMFNLNAKGVTDSAALSTGRID